MRLATICDIHGNLPALEAVLEEIRQAKVDLIVMAGDIVPGPFPRETLTLLLNFGIPVRFIQGNGEVDALAEMAGRPAVRVPEQFREVVSWSARQLYPEYEPQIAGWPKTLRLRLDGWGTVLFCHATPRDDNEIFTRLTPKERLLSIFAGLDAALVICGHTHMQFDRMIGNVRVVNAGSVGMPFGEAGADWLLLDTEIRFRHTSYDIREAAARIEKTKYPQAQDFAAHHVLNPPSSDAMLELFTKAGLK